MLTVLPALLFLVQDPIADGTAIIEAARAVIACCSIRPGMSGEQVEEIIPRNGRMRTGYGFVRADNTSYFNTDHHFGIIDVNVVERNGKVECVRIKKAGGQALQGVYADPDDPFQFPRIWYDRRPAGSDR